MPGWTLPLTAWISGNLISKINRCFFTGDILMSINIVNY